MQYIHDVWVAIMAMVIFFIIVLAYAWVKSSRENKYEVEFIEHIEKKLNIEDNSLLNVLHKAIESDLDYDAKIKLYKIAINRRAWPSPDCILPGVNDEYIGDGTKQFRNMPYDEYVEYYLKYKAFRESLYK